MAAAGAFAAYALVAAVLFRQLLPVLGTHLFSDLGDPLLNTAILAWNARELPLSDAWWNFPSFAPISGVTAFTEHLLLFYPLSTPIIRLGGSAVLAHNVAMILCFPLNGWAAYLLARHLTGSHIAAFVGGLAFAFAPYISVHLSHLQTLAMFGMPLALLGLHRTAVAGSRPVALGLFGLGWLLTALANAYALVFFPVVLALWFVWFVRPREWRALVAPVVTAVLFTLPIVPLLLGYRERQAAYGLRRELQELQLFGADVIGLLGISHREVAWRGVLPHTFEESALFPGLAIAVLAVFSLWRRATGRRSSGPPAPLVRRLLWLAGALALIVAARLWTGPFGWRLGPVPLPPFDPHRLFTLAVVLAIAGAALSRRARDAWTRRDPVFFYAAAVFVLWLLALGPLPEWSASRVRALTYGPYYLLAEVPGFNSVRVPARAWVPAVLALAMLAAYGAARVRERHAAIAAVAVAIVVEGWFADRVVPAPRPMPAGLIPENALVLDLPVNEGFWNAIPQYRAVLGRYRTINGYSGYQPLHFQPLRREIADLYVDALNPYRTFGPLYVVIRDDELPHVAKWVLDHPGAAITHREATMQIVRLPPLVDPPFRPLPLPLPRRGARPFGVR
jgi:hypothetical protein